MLTHVSLSPLSGPPCARVPLLKATALGGSARGGLECSLNVSLSPLLQPWEGVREAGWSAHSMLVCRLCENRPVPRVPILKATALGGSARGGLDCSLNVSLSPLLQPWEGVREAGWCAHSMLVCRLCQARAGDDFTLKARQVYAVGKSLLKSKINVLQKTCLPEYLLAITNIKKRRSPYHRSSLESPFTCSGHTRLAILK
ncbi:hypothetical protein J6590_070005 [Homalodisca vitripennis]|nr:hypothetical protein J6590_070005 [Homalodisca vitripennis]